MWVKNFCYMLAGAILAVNVIGYTATAQGPVNPINASTVAAAGACMRSGDANCTMTGSIIATATPGILFGGNTSSFPMLRQSSGSTLIVRAGDDSQNGALIAGTLTASMTVRHGKVAQTNTAPGAGFAKTELVAGTNAGTCKLIIYAGTSTTPVTILDNIGGGC